MTVLILGDLNDEHAAFMLDYLRDRGADACLIDSRWFPSEMSVTFDPQSGEGSFGFPDDKYLSFRDIESVYWRSYSGVFGPALPDPEQAYIAENDARGLFESILLRLDAHWVNGWSAYQFHQTKPAQLATVANLGVDIPATTLTNDAQAVRDFLDRYPSAIYKPVQGGAHTARIERESVTAAQLRNLGLAPITLQEEIAGTNIRVFVVGSHVMACEVNTEQVDFRDDEEPDIRVHALPENVQTQCQNIATALDLVWTGIDFRRTPEGRYVFLEANPSPMFLGFEEMTGLPLSQRLADELLEGPSASSGDPTGELQ